AACGPARHAQEPGTRTFAPHTRLCVHGPAHPPCLAASGAGALPRRVHRRLGRPLTRHRLRAPGPRRRGPGWRAAAAARRRAGLPTRARVQFAVLPIVFVLAVVVVGVRERRIKEAVREQALPLVLFGATAAALLAFGLSRSAGIYSWLLGFHARPLAIVHW